MIFNLRWIPEFSYIENKIRNPFNLNKSLDFLNQSIKNGEIYQSSESLFWTILLLHQLEKISIVDVDSVRKFILDLKHPDGGYKFSTDLDDADTWSTFYCIATLKLLQFEEYIEIKDTEFIISSQTPIPGGDGGFIHCRSKNCPLGCNGKTSITSSFFSLSTMVLLGKLDKIDRENAYKFLKKKPNDDIELIYQILSLKILNQKETFNLEKNNLIVSIWQIPERGISKQFPSINSTFWTIICLGLLEKLDLVDFGRMFDFLKNMQQDVGGFTEQYTGISSKKPNILSTDLGLICIYYIWDRLIDLIENEILLRTQEMENIYFSLIGKKFSISPKLVKDLVVWMSSNGLINGLIFSTKSRFQEYFDEQNAIAQDIIKNILKFIKSNPDKQEIDLNEFSKNFDFTNALERVKLVINDLIINEYLIGSIKTIKKRYILEDFLILEEHLHPVKQIPFKEIMEEKYNIKRAKFELLTINSELNNMLHNGSETIELLVEEEKISDARVKLVQIHKSIKLKINEFEDLNIHINSNHKYVKSEQLVNKYETKWPIIKNSFEEHLLTIKSKLEERIKEKEEFIKKRAEDAEDQEGKKIIENNLTDNIEKLNQNQVETHNFFSKNFSNHNIIEELIQKSLDRIKKIDSEMNSQLSEFYSRLHFDKYRKEFDKIKTSWKEKKEKSEENLSVYKKIIEKREDLEKFRNTVASEIRELSNEKKKLITNLLNEDKLEESSNLLNESIKIFNQALSKQYESFNEKVNEINNQIEIFPDFSNDIILKWNQSLNDEETNWNNILSEVKHILHLKLELARKDELDKDLKKNLEEIENLIENMKTYISDLIESKKLPTAEYKIKETYSEIDQKIKTYDQEFIKFIKLATTEFKDFNATVSDLIEIWDKKKENLVQYLIKLKEQLETKLDKANSEEKQQELREKVNSELSSFENKINQLELKYNLILKSRKNLEENELKFQAEHSQIQNLLKSLDIQIKNFIKIASKDYKAFNEISLNEEEFWNTARTSIEKKLEFAFNKISEDFFINNIQFIVSAFKGRKIDITYLSKLMKIKPKQLKLKLITLISNSKLDGELESSTDTFTLTDGVVHEGVPIKTIESSEEEVEPDEDDLIRQDILCMRYLMVIHYRVGASVYSRKLGHWKMDSDMIGGFLTAMQDFSAEIKKRNIPMKRMEYKEFEILLEQGKYIFAALFIDGKETNWIRDKLRSYVRKFEKYFESNLKQWQGELRVFSNSGFLVDDVFELYRV